MSRSSDKREHSCEEDRLVRKDAAPTSLGLLGFCGPPAPTGDGEVEEMGEEQKKGGVLLMWEKMADGRARLCLVNSLFEMGRKESLRLRVTTVVSSLLLA
mmetsp:Transcript_30991/g.75803  ORF Transcript_30991/g.75803 Transcript_30991/m.75803 type:complete len:100 (+) Transcript_30991:756-1055(+)